MSITNSRSLPKLMSIESVMPSNRLILRCLLHFLPSIFPSIGVFSNKAVLPIRWPKYWSFSFSISLSNEYSGLISFRIDCLDLLAVQGTQESSETPSAFNPSLKSLGFTRWDSRKPEKGPVGSTLRKVSCCYFLFLRIGCKFKEYAHIHS